MKSPENYDGKIEDFIVRLMDMECLQIGGLCQKWAQWWMIVSSALGGSYDQSQDKERWQNVMFQGKSTMVNKGAKVLQVNRKSLRASIHKVCLKLES
eukprot:15353752-Ditylum_brightwellii.AAC.1